MNENIQALLNGIKTDSSGKWVSIDTLGEEIPKILEACLKEVNRTNVMPCGYTSRDVTIAECGKLKSIDRAIEYFGLSKNIGNRYD